MRKAIIIGGTSGIGRELARIMVGEGYTVGVCGRRPELLQELQKEFPGVILTKQLDVVQPQAMEQLKELITEMGGTDVIVISAGTGDLNKELIKNPCWFSWHILALQVVCHGHFSVR